MRTSITVFLFLISFQLLAVRNLPESLKEKWKEKYWIGLKKARQMGLKFTGITDWTINKKSLKERGPNEILIKIEGTYKVKRGLVHFVEWQHFIGEQYHQVTLTEDLDDTDKVPQAEVNQLMRSVLQLNEHSERIKK